MKNILIINGNPKRESLSGELVNAYERGVQGGNIQRYDLFELEFNPNLSSGYDDYQELEKCLIKFQNSIKWSDHIVIVSPIWWGGIPAKLKGLIDRTFLPGFSFRYEEGSTEPVKLLTGKTSRIVFTMDAPEEYLEEQAYPALEQLDKFILQFCGVEKANVNLFGSVVMADDGKRKEWIQVMHSLGENLI
jgi:putative NADPH-quinone reductase